MDKDIRSRQVKLKKQTNANIKLLQTEKKRKMQATYFAEIIYIKHIKLGGVIRI